jgi:endo-1,4-beta-xylanase
MKLKNLCLVLLTALVIIGCPQPPLEIFEGENIMSLPSMKELFEQDGRIPLIGNIVANPTANATFVNSVSVPSEVSGSGTSSFAISNPGLLRHFNALTAENHMKPSNITNGRASGVISWTWTNADRFVHGAYNSGFKVIGHTLLWHSQIPAWQENMANQTKETALAVMREYVDTVVRRYAGKIHTWDVLNEIFPDNAPQGADWKNAMRRGINEGGQAGNPWYIAIGHEFVYEGFLAARLADPNAILYYNDYNTDMPNRARLIRDMVRYVNDRYLELPAAFKPPEDADRPGRLLIEGIGMQEHHNLSVTTTAIRNSIATFRTLTGIPGQEDIRLSVTELDIVAFPSYSAYTSATGTGGGRDQHANSPKEPAMVTQANLFRSYMNVYLENSDIIERISLWGVTDNMSWRSGGRPLLFDRYGNSKRAYHSFIGALSN